MNSNKKKKETKKKKKKRRLTTKGAPTWLCVCVAGLRTLNSGKEKSR